MTEISSESQTLKVIAEAIADELTRTTNERWAAVRLGLDTDYPRYGVNGPDGLALYLHGPGWAGRGRIGVYGSYPTRNGTSISHDQKRASVTVSATRSPEAIAKDVARRLIPEYRESFDIVQRRAVAHDIYENESNENAAKVRKALRDTQQPHQRPDTFYINLSPGSTYGHGTVSGDRVRFDGLTTDLDKALRIAAILAEGETDGDTN